MWHTESMSCVMPTSHAETLDSSCRFSHSAASAKHHLTNTQTEPKPVMLSQENSAPSSHPLASAPDAAVDITTHMLSPNVLAAMAWPSCSDAVPVPAACGPAALEEAWARWPALNPNGLMRGSPRVLGALALKAAQLRFFDFQLLAVGPEAILRTPGEIPGCALWHRLPCRDLLLVLASAEDVLSLHAFLRMPGSMAATRWPWWAEPCKGQKARLVIGTRSPVSVSEPELASSCSGRREGAEKGNLDSAARVA